MKINKVIEVLLKEIGTDSIGFISGDIHNPGTKDCKLSEGRGSVYGIAIKLSADEKDSFYSKNSDKAIENSSAWKSIGDDYYPLYWGKDINMGSRLHSHTKASKSTGTIQLNKRMELIDKDVIYGAVPCTNAKIIEDAMHNKYPDIYKTRTSNGEEELTISELSINED